MSALYACGSFIFATAKEDSASASSARLKLLSRSRDIVKPSKEQAGLCEDAHASLCNTVFTAWLFGKTLPADGSALLIAARESIAIARQLQRIAKTV